MHAMAEQRTHFNDLLKSRRAELGRSLREMESRSVDPQSGVQAKYGWLSKVETYKSIDTPSEDLLKALSIGYELPIKVLQLAVTQQFLGYDPEADPSVVWSGDLTTRLIVARAAEMTDEDRQQLAEIVETFARRKTQRSDGVGDKPDV